MNPSERYLRFGHPYHEELYDPIMLTVLMQWASLLIR